MYQVSVDDCMERVVLACYDTEAEGRQVCERLQVHRFDCRVCLDEIFIDGGTTRSFRPIAEWKPAREWEQE